MTEEAGKQGKLLAVKKYLNYPATEVLEQINLFMPNNKNNYFRDVSYSYLGLDTNNQY
ncbi:MAG: hypothetical protein V7L20_31090 [Nostoc sp.]